MRTLSCLGMILFAITVVVILGMVVFSTTTTGEVRMVQPNGWTTERDHTYSETNLNNARANSANADANLTNTEAEQMKREIDPPYFDGLKQGAACGVLAVIVVVSAGFMALSRAGVLDK